MGIRTWACLMGQSQDDLIEFERFLVVELEGGVLVDFLQIAIADDKHVQFRSHKTTEGIFRCTDDGFAPHIKACIDDDGATCEFFEALDQRVVFRIGVFVHGLNAR